METPTSAASDRGPGPQLGVPIAIVLAGAVIAAALYFRTDTPAPGPTAVQPSGEATANPQVNVTVEPDDPVLGAAEAPVTIIEFSDFECPFCKQYHDQTFARLKTNYIDTGKVRYVFKHFPLSQIHPQAQRAAEAAQCAHEQGKFWEYGDLLFANQSALEAIDLTKYAETAGLNAAPFAECVATGKHAATVAADFQAGVAAQVAGTPTFVINNQRFDGARPYEHFQQAIDEALKGQS